jgi:hypothetical protein
MENSNEEPDPCRFRCPEPVGRRCAARQRRGLPQWQQRCRRLGRHSVRADRLIQPIRHTFTQTDLLEAGSLPAFLLFSTGYRPCLSEHAGVGHGQALSAGCSAAGQASGKGLRRRTRYGSCFSRSWSLWQIRDGPTRDKTRTLHTGKNERSLAVGRHQRRPDRGLHGGGAVIKGTFRGNRSNGQRS